MRGGRSGKQRRGTTTMGVTATATTTATATATVTGESRADPVAHRIEESADIIGGAVVDVDAEIFQTVVSVVAGDRRGRVHDVGNAEAT